MRFLTLIMCVLIAEHPCLASRKKPRSARSATHHAGKGINIYSNTREMALGRDLAGDVERSARLIEDPVVTEYVNRIGQGLVRESNSPFTVRIRIIRADEANSLALPGGFIYINSALIRATENEAELAAALAHEIAHVASRHYTRQTTCGDILGFASIALLFVGGWPGLLAREGSTFGGPLVMKRFSRGAEAEADRLGIQYLYDAGYDPTAFVDLLERFSRPEQTGPGIFAGFLSTHPSFASRVRAAQKHIQQALQPRSQYLIQTSEFELKKERLVAIESGAPVQWKSTKSPTAVDDRPVLRRHP